MDFVHERDRSAGEQRQFKGGMAEGSYPVQFSVEYPESSNKLTVLARPILAIPIFAIMQLLSGDISLFDPSILDLDQSEPPWEPLLPLAAALWIAPLLMIVFRQKYPLWVFGTYLELYRFRTRVTVYLMLLRDEYPSLDEQQAVSLQIEYPDVKSQLNRFLPIIKWLLAIPHLLALAILWIAAVCRTSAIMGHIWEMEDPRV